MKCSLCGYEYTNCETKHACPFVNQCKLLYCPNCGYKTVVESSIINFFKKKIEQFKKQKSYK
jgi:hypothetical protein